MRTLYLMSGLSFSGKTTLARKIVEWLQCAYISLDDINAERGLWGGDGIPVEEWERTHALARDRLATWMVTRKDALVDDVNNLRWLRDRWRTAASASCYRTLVVFCLSGCFSKPQYVADDTGSTALAITKARLRAHRPLPLKTRD